MQLTIAAVNTVLLLGCLSGAAATAPNTLANHRIKVSVSLENQHFTGLRMENLESGRVLRIPEAFSLDMKTGERLGSQGFSVTAPAVVEELRAQPSASRYSEREAGQQICMDLANTKLRARVRWCGILREGSAYFRQELSLRAEDGDVPIAAVHMVEVDSPQVRVVGTAKGSPAADETMFFGFEHPLSLLNVGGGHVDGVLRRELPLRSGASASYSSVVGVFRDGQIRRAFLEYIERERAHPYRPFLHYNTWYDLGFGDEQHGAQFNDAGALDRIHAFGEALVVKRHAVLDSFLFDDGWDDTNSIWKFNKGFPKEFAAESEAAAQYGAGIGVWLSPWGGYDREKRERIAFGRGGGYEILNDGYALSGPKYYEQFEQACLEMVHKNGVNSFKLDGTGNANQVFPGSRFDSDFDAAIHLIERLRQERKDLFVNLTTGTYPSPFWLLYADSIWRGGDDHAFAGEGSGRQRWITYRDAQTYKNVVQQGPLFPLNSVMLHGLLYALQAEGLNSDPQADFADEIHSFFGSGTQLQEMYITPALLSTKDWDTLAQTAIWSRTNATTLKDTHWIGGDPGQLQVYGWAAWSPAKGTVVLRNPSAKPQEFGLDVGKAFELEKGAALEYTATYPWDSARAAERLRAGKAVRIELKPFEVRVLEAQPIGRR